MNYDINNRKVLEENILSAILIDRSSVDVIVKHNLNRKLFWFPIHKEVITAINKTINKGQKPDLLTVYQFRPDKYRDDSIFYNILISISQHAASTVHIEHWILKLKEYAIIDYWSKISNTINLPSFNWEQIDVFDYVDTIITNYNELESELLKDLKTTNVDYIKQLKIDRENALKGISNSFPTSIDTFDKKYGGIYAPDLITIAGRPGMGKTTLVYRIAKSLSLIGPGMFAGLEASKRQMTNNYLSKELKIDYHKLKTANLTDLEFEKVINAYKILDKSNLQFRDDIRTLRKLSLECDKLYKEGKLRWLIIDYLQLLGVKGGFNRENQVSMITRALKSIALKYNIPVIQISQLSRKVDDRAGHIPMLSDLRESGAIEQDSDDVYFIVRDAYYEKLKNPYIKLPEHEEFATKLIIAKKREGGTGLVEFLNSPL